MRLQAPFSTILLLAATTAIAQPFGGPQTNSFPSPDPIIRAIYAEAMDSSKLEWLAHELLDVIGPRLVGSPSQQKAHDWAVRTFQQWGVSARNEQWGMWRGWERGITHIDLLEPRVRTLEGTMLAWSPGTKKGGVVANTVIMSDPVDSIDFRKWLSSVKGKFVLISPPQLTGRPDDNWEKFAVKESFDRLKEQRKKINDEWMARVRKTGFRADTLANLLEQAGAAGVITNRWSMGWGVDKIFGTNARKAPVVNLSLEDYTLVYRLTESGKKPLVRIEAESKFTGPQPALNTIGEIKGTEKPDEYVVLSAHFDSWDAGSGATDNGTGSILMMEVMRILKKYYPNPKRTILVGLWGSEEQGLNGSAGFVADHPEIIPKIQASFNQDNGTGRVTSMSGAGLLSAGEFLGRWLSHVPSGVTQHIKLNLPGSPAGGGSDNASFTAAGAPGFSLGALDWDYFLYTWHTNRDTYDKLVFDDIKNNAVLAACLAYLASEDPQFMPRVQRVLGPDRQGNPGRWPQPREPERAGGIDKK
ncbi:MAG: M20/M25/M40 family metallo-hydrolase [Bacteroidetes bacterium]|jgi:hypothetical protein|nr:M20/M25/M40 family metallo-hydrolase [Bacteroidota bacterium]